MPRLRLSVLDVGQGQGTLVEVLDDATPPRPVAVVLIDLGSRQMKAERGVPAAGYVAQQLKKTGTPAVLDAVFLSHTDDDHINLTDSLLGHFPSPADLTIREIWYGGPRAGYVKKGRNYLAMLQAYLPQGKKPHSPPLWFSSTYGLGPADWEPVLSAQGMGILVVVGNALLGSAPFAATRQLPQSLSRDGYLVNTCSLLLVIAYGNTFFAVTGDATGLTLSAAVDALDGVSLPGTMLLTVPHHGSERSAYDLKGIPHTGRDAAKANVEAFADCFRAQTIAVSAWEHATYHLPRLKILNAFSTNLSTDGITIFQDPALAAGQHFATAWMRAGYRQLTGGPTARWPGRNGWYTMRTEAPVFTIDYFLPNGDGEYPVLTPGSPAVQYKPPVSFRVTPDRAVAWAFETTGTAKSIAPVADRQVLAGLPAERAAALLAMAEGDEADRFVVLRSAPADPPGAAPPPAAVLPAGPPGRAARRPRLRRLT